MKLLIDMGNSRIKWRLRRGSLTLGAGSSTYSTENPWDWLVEISAVHEPLAVWVVSVAGAGRESQLRDACAELGLPVPQFASTSAAAAGVVCGYRDYRTLGVDRWLALLGARGRGNCLVVDSGTALTVDLLRADGRHLGGYIGPGLGLMRESLSSKSAALAAALGGPLVPRSGAGADTAAAVDGALLSMGVGLIKRALGQMPADTVVLLTGGDADIWRSEIEGALLVPELVFDGLEACFAQDDSEAQGEI